jgi:hypothetical protein
MLVEQNKALLTRIDEINAQNKALSARIAELEGRVGKPPKTPKNLVATASRRQKANVADASTTKKGHKGHGGVTRELCPDPDVTRDIHVDPLRLRRETALCRPGARARL